MLSVAVINCYAQKVMTPEQFIKETNGRSSMYEGVYREGRPQMILMSLAGAVTVDQSRIVVRYDADIRLDSLSTNRVKDQVQTLIGPKYMLSHGLWFWVESLDSGAYYAKSKEEKVYFETLKSEYGKRPKDYNEMIAWFVYRDLNGRTVLNKHGLPMRTNTIEYTESQPKMTWTMSEETKEILGYECQKAETDFRGRHWIVWFTPEVAVDCGFWKFSGLPGLIMEADSSDDFYRYTAVSIENRSMKIQKYPKATTQRLSREQFRKAESAAFAHPMIGSTMYQKTGQDYMIGSHISAYEGPKDIDTKIFTVNNFLGLYFPMELE